MARALAVLRPASGATTLRVAGGQAIFAGVASPLTQACALGMNGAVREAEIEAMEDFYRSRGAAASVEVCPLADPSLLALLEARGYRHAEFTNKLFQTLDDGVRSERESVDVVVRRVVAETAEGWAEVVSEGFAGKDHSLSHALLMEMAHAGLRVPSAVAWLAEADGQAAGGGTVFIDDGVAMLKGTSVLPAFRRRGVQSALIGARLAYAASQGCDLATVTTVPGTASQRNVERHGFRVAYTRSRLARKWS